MRAPVPMYTIVVIYVAGAQSKATRVLAPRRSRSFLRDSAPPRRAQPRSRLVLGGGGLDLPHKMILAVGGAGGGRGAVLPTSGNEPVDKPIARFDADGRMSTSLPALIVTGFLLGWSVAWPPGPINAEIARRCGSGRFLSGIAVLAARPAPTPCGRLRSRSASASFHRAACARAHGRRQRRALARAGLALPARRVARLRAVRPGARDDARSRPPASVPFTAVSGSARRWR